MDWFLYDNGLRHERVTTKRVKVFPEEDEILIQPLQLKSFREVISKKLTVFRGQPVKDKLKYNKVIIKPKN